MERVGKRGRESKGRSKERERVRGGKSERRIRRVGKRERERRIRRIGKRESKGRWKERERE